MAGLVPAIPIKGQRVALFDRDRRDKPGDDGERYCALASSG